jgi:hypothetical protein
LNCGTASFAPIQPLLSSHVNSRHSFFIADFSLEDLFGMVASLSRKQRLMRLAPASWETLFREGSPSPFESPGSGKCDSPDVLGAIRAACQWWETLYPSCHFNGKFVNVVPFSAPTIVGLLLVLPLIRRLAAKSQGTTPSSMPVRVIPVTLEDLDDWLTVQNDITTDQAGDITIQRLDDSQPGNTGDTAKGQRVQNWLGENYKIKIVTRDELNKSKRQESGPEGSNVDAPGTTLKV